ncbi:MAG TPA: serine/threonine-protein kinase [Polyangiaceae bacterium]|nr:serine/threonine-protein kinase [Polyangiaceae bacterium]
MRKPQTFGPYDLFERIGVGALGEVFRAVSREDGRLVALKRVMPYLCEDREVVEMLKLEAKLAADLDHPSVARVVDAGEVAGVHYIAYAFVDGRDLRAIHDRALRGGHLMPLDVAIYIVLRIAEGLAYVHNCLDAGGKPLGLVHRDVSPSNILVSFDGDVKLTDFGIAYIEGRLDRTPAGQIKGTFSYMSPEQATGGAIDGRSDVFSLGVCLWELSTGKRLFDGLRLENVLRRIASGTVDPPRAHAGRVSPELEAVILKALAQTSDRRYPNADQLFTDLSRLAQAEHLVADPIRVAHYVRSLFPEAAAEGAASR